MLRITPILQYLTKTCKSYFKNTLDKKSQKLPQYNIISSRQKIICTSTLLFNLDQKT